MLSPKLNLEELVPPVELCKQIPEGEFAGSVFVWSYSCDRRNTEPFVDRREDVEYCRRDLLNAPPVHPAPTLEEIMASFSYCRVYKKSSGKFIACRNKFREVAENGATAALKLWLKEKGGEQC